MDPGAALCPPASGGPRPFPSGQLPPTQDGPALGLAGPAPAPQGPTHRFLKALRPRGLLCPRVSLRPRSGSHIGQGEPGAGWGGGRCARGRGCAWKRRRPCGRSVSSETVWSHVRAVAGVVPRPRGRGRSGRAPWLVAGTTFSGRLLTGPPRAWVCICAQCPPGGHRPRGLGASHQPAFVSPCGRDSSREDTVASPGRSHQLGRVGSSGPGPGPCSPQSHWRRYCWSQFF